MTQEKTVHPVPEALAVAGRTADAELDLARTALVFASLRHPGLSLERYENHLKKIADDTGARFAELIAAGAENNLRTRLAALKHTIADKHGYEWDEEKPSDIDSADLIRTVERRKGGAVALAVLYIHAAKAQGWAAYGLAIPGHYGVRLDDEKERIMFDPAARCEILEAHDLRRLVKKALGDDAELSATYYEPVPQRAILIRLQNVIKSREIEAEDYDGALRTVEAMLVLDPSEYRLRLEAGVLYERTGRREEALSALEAYIAAAPEGADRREAMALLRQIRVSP